jgi:hypothetical protein
MLRADAVIDRKVTVTTRYEMKELTVRLNHLRCFDFECACCGDRATKSRIGATEPEGWNIGLVHTRSCPDAPPAISLYLQTNGASKRNPRLRFR